MRISLLTGFFVLIIITGFSKINASQRINDIYIDRLNVFDSTQSDWFFAAPLANSLHVLTKRYIIEDELLFNKDDVVDYDLIYETERNLRATNLFTKVKIELDSVSEYYCDVYLTTQDRWSTSPSILLGTGGNATSWGGKIEEYNFLGTGTGIDVEALHRSENNIGWQGMVELTQRRLFRSEYTFFGSLQANRYRTEQDLSIYQPFRTLATEWSYGFNGQNNFGSDFKYNGSSNIELIEFHSRNLMAWISHSWKRIDRVFATFAIELNDVNRQKPDSLFRQAYDNTGRIYIAFSSVGEDFIKTNKLNQWQDEDLPIGGWGTAILGKTFAIRPGGVNLYYLGGQGEKSYLYKNLYLFGQMTGASSFSRDLGRFTYEEFFGLGFFRITQSMLLAARFRQQSVWNWDALRQLVLDNDFGLRGYDLNSFSGDNRIIANLEFRLFPDFNIWFLKTGGTAFWDAGTVWDQTVNLNKTRWHNSLGFGLRFQVMKTTGPTSLFRIDFAFNCDQKKFGSIIFTTDQLFSVFQKHDFRLPELFGSEYDYE
jgi:hypothetical protein